MNEAINVKSVMSKRDNFRQSSYKLLKKIFVEKKVLLFLVSFLLGRAVILYSISPFTIAFLATVLLTYRKRLFVLSTLALFGAWTYTFEHATFITLSSLIFLLFMKFLQRKNKLITVILFMTLSLILTRILLYSSIGEITLYEWMMMLTEAALSVILLFIFMQSVPLIVQKKYQPELKNEELICILILFASILTVLIGWDIYNISLEHVFSRYIVLVLAFIGGAAIGSTVGVVTGLILSLANVANLYHMSLLAFSGLLGGLLQDGKKIASSIGLLIGTLLVGLYGGASSFSNAFIESFIAIILFYITPQIALKKIAKLIPGTIEYSNEERKYLQKMRDVTAQRVEQFSQVFEALSQSFFLTSKKTTEQEKMDETDYFLSVVTEKTCQLCFMKKRCWQNNFDKTYNMMEKMKNDLLDYDEMNDIHVIPFENYCVKSRHVIEAMEKEIALLKINKQLKKQVKESKKIVADQLKGVSDVMDNFANEIVKERKRHEKQEIEIVRALKRMDIELEKLDIYRLDRGNIDIEMGITLQMYRGEGPKLIAPILTNILKETIVVLSEDVSPFPNSTTYITFGSAKRYEVTTGIACAAQGGGLVSGDAYTKMEIGKGKYALAISDGMGNGLRAREESMETLRLLKQILQTGISEQVAIQSINSILTLRTTDEIFATLDLAIINLHNAMLRCLKIGSAPSFIKRGKEFIRIHANNLPIGIVEHVELELVSEKLKPGDMLIMMSDGVYDGPRYVKNNERWLERKITQMKTSDPQEIADLLLEEIIRTEHGIIRDDMTVIVAKIDTFTPEWATIPYLRDEAT